MTAMQILNNPRVWYSRYIPRMIKILYQNITQRWTKATGQGIRIVRWTPNSQHGRHIVILRMLAVFFFQLHEWRSKEPHKSKMQAQKMDSGRQQTSTTAILGATLNKEAWEK